MRYALLAFALAACGAPNAIPPSPCSPACSPGQACIAGRCFVEVDADAGPGDAAVGDAPIDVATPDAPADATAPDAAVGDIDVDTPPPDVLTPNRTAYQRCDPAVDVCAAGTTCIASVAQVAGKNRGVSCTVTCPSGNASSCPGYVPGAATQRVECANFTGNLAQAQCFRLCTTQNDCASDNTTCTAFMMPTGQIRVCVPAGTRI